MIQSLAYLEQQICVYPRSHKQLVKVLARTVYLLSQPSDAPALPVKLCFYQFADVKLTLLVMVMSAHNACLSRTPPSQANKKGVHRLSLIPIEGVWKAHE